MTWPALAVSEQGLEIAATCTIAELDAAILPETWTAAQLIGQCCRALWASFKIWNIATVGGNICLALPAGAMIALATALDGIGTVWGPDGQDRRIPIIDLITGPSSNALRANELLRRIDIPAEALTRRSAFRQISLTRHGRSGTLLIGTRPNAGSGFTLTITASTPRPVQMAFPDLPEAAELAAAIDRDISASAWFDDMHGQPDWRRHVTLLLAEDIRRELAPGFTS